MRSYEIRVAGPIGPVVASALPGFVTVEVSTCSSVLTGTVDDVEGLLGVINVLSAHGFSPVDTEISCPDPGRPRGGIPDDAATGS